MSGYFVVTHNGYDTQYFDTPAEVEEFIKDTLAAHKDLKPRQIFRANGEDNRTEEPMSTITRVLIYQYTTLYTEVFMIERRGV